MINSTTAKPLRFNSDGRLKVMHITDTHLEDDNIEASVWLMANACDREKPDAVIITGDNVQNCDDSAKTKGYIDKLMNVFEARKIPVAVTFGNHDSEVGSMSREELMAYYNTYSCSISIDDGDLLSGCGTYNIPVLSSNGEKMKFNLWVFDSNDYDGKGHYGCVLADQVEWYKQKSDELTKANGEKVYSFAFQHMIVADVYDALKKSDKKRFFSYSHMYNKDDYYMFDPCKENFGTLTETPCSGYENYGQFEAMVEKGDVLAIFSGHDHTNAFGVKHKGIDICNSLSTRYNGDAFSSQCGYRILEVNEKTPSTYTSRVVHWYDMITMKDVKAAKAKGDTFGCKTAFDVKWRGTLMKSSHRFGRFWIHKLTGRKVTYKD
ncbi:MAG: metallophosphoesterase [Clostridia bacterium]|nr:metallophosphoesterase [Clostridia bacterium]